MPVIDKLRSVGGIGGKRVIDMKIPRHIVWSTDKAGNIDLDEPENRQWRIKQA